MESCAHWVSFGWMTCPAFAFSGCVLGNEVGYLGALCGFIGGGIAGVFVGVITTILGVPSFFVCAALALAIELPVKIIGNLFIGLFNCCCCVQTTEPKEIKKRRDSATIIHDQLKIDPSVVTHPMPVLGVAFVAHELPIDSSPGLKISLRFPRL